MFGFRRSNNENNEENAMVFEPTETPILDETLEAVEKAKAEKAARLAEKTQAKAAAKKAATKSAKSAKSAKSTKPAKRSGRITSQDFELVKMLVSRGCSAKNITQIAEVSPVTVTIIRESKNFAEYQKNAAERNLKYKPQRDARRAKKTPTGVNHGRRLVNESNYATAKSLLNRGEPRDIIAQVCGLSRTTISRICNSDNFEDYCDRMYAQGTGQGTFGHPLAKRPESVKLEQKEEVPEQMVTTEGLTATIDLAALEASVRKDANILCERLLDLSSQQLTVENLDNAQRVIEHFATSCQTLKGIKTLSK